VVHALGGQVQQGREPRDGSVHKSHAQVVVRENALQLLKHELGFLHKNLVPFKQMKSKLRGHIRIARQFQSLFDGAPRLHLAAYVKEIFVQQRPATGGRLTQVAKHHGHVRLVQQYVEGHNNRLFL
jgi:hypothetical protein